MGFWAPRVKRERHGFRDQNLEELAADRHAAQMANNLWRRKKTGPVCRKQDLFKPSRDSMLNCISCQTTFVFYGALFRHYLFANVQLAVAGSSQTRKGGYRTLNRCMIHRSESSARRRQAWRTRPCRYARCVDLARGVLPDGAVHPAAGRRHVIARAHGSSAHCPYKGDASYFSIPFGGERSKNAIRTYEDPHAAVAEIEYRLAFYPDRVDSIEELQVEAREI